MRKVNFILIAHSSKAGLMKGVRGGVQIESKVSYMIGFSKLNPCVIYKDNHGNRTGLSFKIDITDGTFLTDRPVTMTPLFLNMKSELTEKEVRDMFKLTVLKGRVARVGIEVFNKVFKDENTTKVVRLKVLEDYILQTANLGLKPTNETYLAPTYITVTLPSLLKALLPITAIQLGKTGRKTDCVSYINVNNFKSLFLQESMGYAKKATVPLLPELEANIFDSLIVDTEDVEVPASVTFDSQQILDVENILKTQLKGKTTMTTLLDTLKDTKRFSVRNARAIVNYLITLGTFSCKKDGKTKVVSIVEVK